MSAPRKVTTALLLVLGLAGAGWFAYYPAPPNRPAAPHTASSPASAAEGQPVRRGCHGGPLPAGAVSRLGTLRFRRSPTISCLISTGDGKTQVGMTWENTFHVWDRASGRELRRLVLREDWRKSVAITRDGKLFAAGCRDNEPARGGLAQGPGACRSRQA